jgi:radical SAM protein with 4Fe4S-binding SPASM domain
MSVLDQIKSTRPMRLVKRALSPLVAKLKYKSTDFPPEIWIENTNYCNAHCVMCPREKLTRPKGYMDLELFRKLITEVAANKGKVKRVHLHNYGEPLLDKNLFERIRIAKEVGVPYLYFVTNASLLTPEKSEKLVHSGLDSFKISFYGTDREAYNKTMVHLDFDKTFKNIKDFLEIRKKAGTKKPSVTIQFLPQSTNEYRTEEFMAMFRPLIDTSIGDQLSLSKLNNFGGGRSYNDLKGKVVATVCSFPWDTMVVLWDGRVASCCLDFDGQQQWGDVRTKTIKEIWAAFEPIRKDFASLNYDKYPKCRDCEIIY